ncbi:TcpE family conjugal transfer membrane protein [Alicyclobacillus sp. ALC3]|uniref:TcpE family conjugal transfer membrane protein n=1 Tax=Alicyclobacillus sp. ALC3 TaxID=2796143 RepID=UPI002378B555|nr:TcpE family conjugal transfer membrane protein [Alicyclobacillus sp. ALC3]WDL96668.1 hypothetical protein JC200_20555 [Alicyclobacillus sp. ALC3]
MQKSTETRYAAYRSLFRVKTVLYQIGDIRLWMPIDRDLILLWVQTFAFFLLFYYVIPVLAWVSPFGPALSLSVGPAGLAYLLHKLDPAGKSTSMYLRDILRYLISKKYVRRFERISPPRSKRTVNWSIRGRRVHRIDVENEFCIKFFMAEPLQGTLQPGSVLRVYPPSKIRWHARVHRFSLTPLPSRRHASVEDIRATRRGRTWFWTVTTPADITVQAASAKARLHQRRGVQ